MLTTTSTTSFPSSRHSCNSLLFPPWLQFATTSSLPAGKCWYNTTESQCLGVNLPQSLTLIPFFDLPCLVLTNQDVTMWPVCWCHHCVPLHRPLSAQSRAVIHSTSVPSNYTAHVLFPVAVLQLTQIPPSSTDCLQIWQGWPTNTNHLYGMSLTCNCSVYCTLPKSVCILLQINIRAFFRLIVYFY